MKEDVGIVSLRQPNSMDDPLTETAREGARQMLAAALRAEAASDWPRISCPTDGGNVRAVWKRRRPQDSDGYRGA